MIFTHDFHTSDREEASESSFREEAQEFRNRARYPAQARFDPFRPMAEIRDSAEAEGRPSPTSQGPTSDQPVHDDPRSPYCRSGNVLNIDQR